MTSIYDIYVQIFQAIHDAVLKQLSFINGTEYPLRRAKLQNGMPPYPPSISCLWQLSCHPFKSLDPPLLNYFGLTNVICFLQPCVVNHFVCCGMYGCCTLTWKNSYAKCVEFNLKINQSIKNLLHLSTYN